MNLVTSSSFEKDLRKYLKKNSLYKIKVSKCLGLMLENIYHPSLRLHKLIGHENYSVSVDMKIRIIFRLEKDNIFLLRIGNHRQVY